jgi:hypothetical protein
LAGAGCSFLLWLVPAFYAGSRVRLDGSGVAEGPSGRALAAPFYNFTDPTLKPWHPTATYQLVETQSNVIFELGRFGAGQLEVCNFADLRGNLAALCGSFGGYFLFPVRCSRC